MDNAAAGNNGDSDLSESWTLIEKESLEPDDGLASEENTTEKSKSEILPDATDETQSTCELCESVDSPDYLPPDTTVKSPSEGAESIDSDGISIISESEEEEEELHLLPCNPPIREPEERPGSRTSNKYFDETDSSSQCSSRSHDSLGTSSEKKYVHQPNSALNTSLNILLAIACAAVLGLGFGHFMGLQEECPAENAVENKIVNATQNEELSALLLKKLELENNALKEQFANLQSVIDEIRRNNSVSPCNNKYSHENNAGNLGSKEEDKILDMKGARCEIPQEFPEKDGIDRGMPQQRKKDPYLERASMNEDALHRTSSGDIPTPPDETMNGKDEYFPKLEKSLEDIASLFHSTLNGEKSLPEGAQEALSVAFSVFSTLMDNVQEKLNGLKKSMDEGTLNFDVPLKAISKMEDVIQKTSQKIQKVAKDALKEGQPLYTISSGITSKLKTINKKLEHKWCQIKKNLSKQSMVLSWLDDQIFHNCSDEEAEDEGIKAGADDDMFAFQAELKIKPSELGLKKRKFDRNDVLNEKYNDLRKKAKIANYEGNYKNKDRGIKNDYKQDNLKDKYKNGDHRDPNAFDFDYVPKKGRNQENRQPKMEGKRRKVMEGKSSGSGGNGRYSGKQNELAPSGEWVEAMFNSRAERRRDERRSDWVFARARARTRSRETQPSRWYFRKGEEKQ